MQTVRRIMAWFISSSFIIATVWQGVMATSPLENLPKLHHYIEGNIIIGMINMMYRRGNMFCNTEDVSTTEIQFMLAAIYRLEKINSNPNILGKIKLGLNALESCSIATMSVAQALSLVAQSDQSNLDILGLEQIDNGRDRKIMIGIVGPPTSALSLPVSNTLGVFDIPIVSPSASSDELGNREIYPNFFRVVPPDKFQSKVMVDLFREFNWTYVSVVHSRDSYGYNGLTYIRRHSQKVGICIAEAFPISEDFEERDYENLIHKIIKIKNANVIAMITSEASMRGLLKAANDLGIHHLIWVLSDIAYAGTVSGTGRASQGSFLVDWKVSVDDEIREYLEGFTLAKDISNSYVQAAWLNFFPEQCGLDLNVAQCKDSELKEKPGFWLSSVSSFILEVLDVFALSLDAFVRDKCPAALKDPEQLKNCYTQGEFMPYLYNVSLPTSTGEKAFDEEGSMALDFRIRQVQDEVVEVGIWRRQYSGIEWSRPLSWREETTEGIPESVCAKPCELGEFYIQGELPCCWECHRCRDNEVVADNGTTCEPCPILTWPENETFTTCVDIAPSYISWSDVYGIGLTCLSALGLFFTLVLLYTVLKYRNRRVIKGATWPMLMIILTGLTLAFSDVVLFIALATDIVCICNRMLFSLSCTFIFGPLLMKTFRVYLVFRASSKLRKVSRLAAAPAQYTITSIIILIQCGILVFSAVWWPIKATLTMPVMTEPYVELSCSQHQIGLLIPLSFNLLLLLFCSLIAFLTRKLPDNFNESWYIFLNVTTTLFIWIAFLPTYYAAFYAYHKSALLALAMSLNGLVTIVCLFSPKIYALKFIDEKDIKITDFNTTSFETPTMKSQDG